MGEGEDPDPRFTLANERTFLSWIRTALALLAGGIAVEAFTQQIFPPAVRLALAVALLLLGIALSVGAFFRWVNVERSLRRRKPLPVPLIAPVVSAAVAAASGGLLAVILL
ncbi:YidH family protein [Nesterenkonia alba]|uniref:YidH family protein n=1 Tax=Nesterenkonia alba TaxID=515814 RepID=UPI000683E1FB|nr:DUF202 domain-containing protein [Nesterenkonia alba]